MKNKNRHSSENNYINKNTTESIWNKKENSKVNDSYVRRYRITKRETKNNINKNR